MYTWEFTYDEEINDGFGFIRFCAETEDKAIELFNNWCEENGYGSCTYTVETVFDTDDYKEYGDQYRW